MKPILTETLDTIVVIKLNRGVTNALNLELLHALAEALDQVRQDPNVHGLVLTSESEKFFSIGFDIPQLFDLARPGFEVFYQTFNRVCLNLFTLTKPTVVALRGHAVAGGCVLALCCDYRFSVEGRTLMGLNEVKLGVPVPYVADRIMHKLAGIRIARDVMESGEFFEAADSLRMGLVDRILPIEQVLEASIEKAATMGAFPRRGLAMIKRNRVETVEAEVRASLTEKERVFIDCWYDEDTRERLREAMEKYRA